MSINTETKDCSVQKTYNRIYEEIIEKNYKVGTKLEPLRAMAKKYNVSYLTAQKAIKILQMQGALEAKPGNGIYVIGKPRLLNKDLSHYLENSQDNQNRNIKKNFSICIVMPFWVSNRGSVAIYSMIKGILSQSDKHDWSVELLHNSGDESDNEPSHPEFIKKIEARQPDGIIWLQPIPTHRMNIMRLVDKGYKVVTTGRNFKDIPVKCIQIDMQQTAEKIFEQISKYNSRKIAMLTGPIEGVFKDPYSVDLVSAVKKVFDSHGLTLDEKMICQAGFSNELSLIIKNFLNDNKDIDGIICMHEHILSCIEELEHSELVEFNKKIPLVDVSGIFNIQKHLLKNLDIRQIKWPLENMGKAVIDEFEQEWISDHKPGGYKFYVEIDDNQ